MEYLSDFDGEEGEDMEDAADYLESDDDDDEEEDDEDEEVAGRELAVPKPKPKPTKKVNRKRPGGRTWKKRSPKAAMQMRRGRRRTRMLQDGNTTMIIEPDTMEVNGRLMGRSSSRTDMSLAS